MPIPDNSALTIVPFEGYDTLAYECKPIPFSIRTRVRL